MQPLGEGGGGGLAYEHDDGEHKWLTTHGSTASSDLQRLAACIRFYDSTPFVPYFGFSIDMLLLLCV